LQTQKHPDELRVLFFSTEQVAVAVLVS
jgi:hypothetical protein